MKSSSYLLLLAYIGWVMLAAAPALAVDFDSEIIPILTRSGCNAGACHGSAAGRGDFRLSLLGGNPAADYESIVRDLEGRRVNLTKPSESLLIAKPTGLLSHGGAVALESPGAEKLVAWIAAGALRDKSRRLVQFEVEPRRSIAAQVGAELPLRAIARFDDSVAEDVTEWTVFSAADPASITIDPDRNVATVLRRGQHVIVARFLDRVVPIELTLPLSDAPIDLTDEPRANFIDDEIVPKLELLRLPTAPRADDSRYIRRVFLALTGSLPPRDEVEAYLSDRALDKQSRLIERLLESEAFTDYWTYRFATLLRIRALPNDHIGIRVYHAWLQDQIRSHAPLDQVARELLTASGDSHSSGPANFARISLDARAEAELVSETFLGVRLKCANCHNHPLDRWTQDDYHGLAAVFSHVERGRNVTLTGRGAVTNLLTGEPALPKLPGDRYLDAAGNADCRVEFADWLTQADNPYFARAMVNRLWRAMFGRGLVEPVDDFRPTNPATHPELLDRLAADFVAHRYDIRRTLRLIANSETFRRGESFIDTPVEGVPDDRFYSRAIRRPLEPEVLADAIAATAGVSDQYGDEPAGTRAIALVDPATPAASLDALGRCSREATCEGATAGGGLPAKLHQLNGEFINRKIASTDGRLHRHLATGSTNEAIVDDFYLRALSRWPTDVEREFWRQEFVDVGEIERTLRLEDFVWSLFNCDEFTTNH